MKPSEWIEERMEKRWKEHEDKMRELHVAGEAPLNMRSIQDFWILAITEYLDEHRV